MESTKPPLFASGLRLLMFGLGLASFAAGAVAVFQTTNGAGTAVLLTFGGFWIVLAILGNRIDSFEFGGMALKLRAAAAQKFALAEQFERLGDTEEARRLRAEAQAMLAAAAPIAAEYNSLRSAMPAGPDRTALLDALVADARQKAASEPPPPAAVHHLFEHGDGGDRATALGMMQGAPTTRDFAITLKAVKDPKTPFEHYHALVLAGLMLEGMNTNERRAFADVLNGQWSRVSWDRDLRELRSDLLRRLEEPRG